MRIGRTLLFFLLLAGLSCAAYGAQGRDASPAAKIVSLEGDVQVRLAPDAEWKNAEKGLALGQGAEILTGSKSFCELALGNGQRSVIKLNPDSKARLTSLQPVSVDLQSGKLFALVRGLGKGSTFQVSTPTAVASARGTGWGQDHHSVQAFEDDVFVHGSGGEEGVLSEGRGLFIGEDGSFGEEYDLPADAREEWSDFREDVEDHMAGAGAGEGETGGEGTQGGGTEGASDDAMGAGTEDETFDERNNVQDDLLEAKDEGREAADEGRLEEMLSEEEEESGGYY